MWIVAIHCFEAAKAMKVKKATKAMQATKAMKASERKQAPKQSGCHHEGKRSGVTIPPNRAAGRNLDNYGPPLCLRGLWRRVPGTEDAGVTIPQNTAAGRNLEIDGPPLCLGGL